MATLAKRDVVIELLKKFLVAFMWPKVIHNGSCRSASVATAIDGDETLSIGFPLAAPFHIIACFLPVERSARDASRLERFNWHSSGLYGSDVYRRQV